jgi:flagellar motor switch protein FliN/FliY
VTNPLAAPHALPDLTEIDAPAGGRDGRPLFDLKTLGDLVFRVDVPLGSLRITLREFLGLKVGSVLPLDTQTGESLAILVNGTPIAKGEVRIHGEFFAVRVTGILRADPPTEEESDAPAPPVASP